MKQMAARQAYAATGAAERHCCAAWHHSMQAKIYSQG
jgi:hypothetical protein